MAVTDAAARLTEQHRLAQTRLGAHTSSTMLEAWNLVDLTNLDATLAPWLQVCVPLILSRQAVSANLAGTYAQAFRRHELGPSDWAPTIARSTSPTEVARRLTIAGPVQVKARTARGVQLRQAGDLSRNGVARTAQHVVLAGGRDTIVSSVAADPQALGYARAASGNACAFCRMLASRGPVYSAATVHFDAHGGCNCSAEPVYDRTAPWPAGSEQYRKQWDDLTAGQSGLDAINAFRRDIDSTSRATARAEAAKVADKLAAKVAATQAVADAAARYGVSVDELTAARPQVRELRRRIADEAAAAQYDSLKLLDSAEALKVQRPPRTGTGRGGEWDWLERVGGPERARLSRKWYTDAGLDPSRSRANSVDNIADNLRRQLGGDLLNMTDDQVMTDVWLHHTRQIEAAGALRRGKLPSPRLYGGRVDIDAFAPGVTGDGYDIVRLLDHDLDAAGHIASVHRSAHADDAYRALGRATTPANGPSPWEMSYQAWDTEVRTLEEGLDGATDLTMTPAAARTRLAELMPPDIDGDGFSYEDYYAAIVTTARTARLDVPAHAVIPWA